MTDRTIEVVVSHDILQVPFEDSLQYVWSGTQTFSIEYLNNESSEGADSSCSAAVSSFNSTAINNPVTCNKDKYICPTTAVQQTSEMEPACEDSNAGFSNSYEIIDPESGERYFIQEIEEKIVPETDPVDIQDSVDVKPATSTEFEAEQPQLREPSSDLLVPMGDDNCESSKPLETIPCGVCQLTFSTESEMHKHRLKHFFEFEGTLHLRDIFRITCTYCDRRFRELSALSNHMYEHFRKGLLVNPRVRTRSEVLCGVCEQTFPTDGAMHEHRIQHFAYKVNRPRVLGPRKCRFCDREFSEIIDLSEHIYEHYRVERFTKLERKKAKLQDNTSAKTLTKNTSSHSKLFATRPSALAVTHRESDSNVAQQNYPTTNNDRQSSPDRTIADKSSSAKREYLANKDPPPKREQFACGMCEMKFVDSSVMHRHRLAHFGYFGLKGTDHKCALCDDRFYFIADLSNHIIGHMPHLKQQMGKNVSSTNVVENNAADKDPSG